MFLTNLDYASHQRDIDLNILTLDSNIGVRNFAENSAIEQIKSYLRKRFDVNEIFIHVRIWNAETTYSVGDHVEFDGAIYYAESGNIDTEPGDDVAEWTMGDLRDPYLVMTAVDMAVYHMHAKIPNRQTPQDVNDRYADALAWLQGVSKGEFVPNYPELNPEENQTNFMQFGSQTKLNHRY